MYFYLYFWYFDTFWIRHFIVYLSNILTLCLYADVLLCNNISVGQNISILLCYIRNL